jgi:hypothetical protein
MFDRLFEQGRLSHLPRASQDDGRRETRVELSQKSVESPAAVDWKNSPRLLLPPRVCAPEVLVQNRGQSDLIK